MWYKQQTEIAIMPRIFKGIKIAYKGDYSFKFQLIHQSQKGTRTSAYPYVFKHQQNEYEIKSHTNMKNAIKKSIKTNISSGKTKIENNYGSYQTNKFKVNFENHTQFFSQMLIFKQQYKLRRFNKEGKTCLLIHLENHQSNNLLQIKTEIKTVFTQKVYINRHKKQFNFIIINILVFWYYILALCIWVGRLETPKWASVSFFVFSQRKSVKFLKEEDNAQQKKVKLVNVYCSQHVTVYKIFNNFIKKQQKSQFRKFSGLTKCFKIFSLRVKIHYQHFQSTAKYYKNQINIYDYYECTDINELYFLMHYEDCQLSENTRTFWQELLNKIKTLTVVEFEKLSQAGNYIYEREWKNSCVKFIKLNNSGQQIQLQTQSATSIVNKQNYEQSQIKKAKNNRFTNQSNQSSVYNFSLNKIFKKHDGFYSPRTFTHLNIHQQIKQTFHEIRLSLIEKYKLERQNILSNQQLSYDQDITNPLMIVQNYSNKSKQKQYKLGTTGLVVFIHGLKGSQFDLQKASQYLLKYNEGVEILLIKSIEHDVDYNIDEMANLVAVEIKKHILCSLFKIQSISIVGYSLGGVIGRAILPHLEAYKQKMNLFVSFSSPHLGTSASSNNLVNFGIWYMTKISKNTILEQLHTCRDLKTSTKSYMKLLSQQKQISWFKKVILLSCQEDEFVPHVSSRVQENISYQETKNAKSKQKNKIEDLYRRQMAEMSQNIRKFARRIQRIEMWFDNQNKYGTIDRLTGRHSHIQFLDNPRFLRMFFQLYAKQF